MRGLTDSVVIEPNVAKLEVMTGLENCGWFHTLKNSGPELHRLAFPENARCLGQPRIPIF
jgi:hypothetical protein